MLARLIERTDEEVEQGIAYIKPMNKLDPTTIEQLGLRMNDHEDAFYTKRPLHAYRLLQKKRSSGAHDVFYLYEITVPHETGYPGGLPKGSQWRSNGSGGIYKTGHFCKINQVIKVELGRMLNIADEDTVIKLVWSDDGRVDEAPLTLNSKQNLNAHSPHYNGGLYYLSNEQDQPDSDNESVGQETTFGNAPTPTVVNAAEESEARGPNDPDEAFVIRAARVLIRNSERVQGATTATIRFDEQRLPRISKTAKKRILAETLRRAEEHWGSQGCEFFKILIDVSPANTTKFTSLGYTPESIESGKMWLYKSLPTRVVAI